MITICLLAVIALLVGPTKPANIIGHMSSKNTSAYVPLDCLNNNRVASQPHAAAAQVYAAGQAGPAQRHSVHGADDESA